MSIEDECVQNLTVVGYHPRSSKHSDFLSGLIVRDLVARCPAIEKRAAAGEIVAKLRHHQQVGHADWVIDIAIGTCAGIPNPPVNVQERQKPITLAPPVLIQIAIELKSIFTEHGKNRRNRLRDFEAFHGYAHQYDPRTVAAGFLEVNSSQYFASPLRKPDDITEHGNTRATARQIARNAIDIFRSIHLRLSASDAPGMEAVGVIVVEHDNLAFHPTPAAHAVLHRPTGVAPIPPSLSQGDPLHYESMIQRICAQYTNRFG